MNLDMRRTARLLQVFADRARVSAMHRLEAGATLFFARMAHVRCQGLQFLDDKRIPRIHERAPFTRARTTGVRVLHALLAFISFCPSSSTLAQAPADPQTLAWRQTRQAYEQRARAAAGRGAAFLVAAQQKDGGWVPDSGPGISALCVRALAWAPGFGPEHAAVRRGADFVLKFQRDDGGIYSAEGFWKNYETSVVLSMLAALGDAHAGARARATRFVKESQWDEGEEKSVDDAWYGGAGYGQGKRPDLSNTQIMLDALHDSGLPKDDPVYQKALIFVQRCQMRGESNDQAYAISAGQGGFIYSAANGGESKAGTMDVEGRKELRAYGSMTYAGLKSMIFAGLTKDDPRVQAALEWIRSNWTLEYNPGMPNRSVEGLYYYFHTFARCLAAYGDMVITDRRGEQHFWREELVEQLERLQKSDGRWVNSNPRWMEGQAELTTAYALLALHAAYPSIAATSANNPNPPRKW